ncbi:outer membrane lipoprotein-sorting protein [Acidovorax sp. D2M1]|uniref:Outer membrane lipoprotein-sorting protein n=1 Tax=Acidovorax benzenivorans TaxID=2987520 RepID=A0ABT5S318_9BURK|nr:outer membrane lipoprotein-sorting protein [Acidovorax benzenivorans]MDD2180055.1 outer membrane lipoprotein-sorting protein [Acidovorax benzenivorans]
MQRRPLLALPLAALAPWCGTSFAAPDPQAVLAASDAIRNPDFSFRLVNTLVEYRQGRQTDSSQLAVYSRPDTVGGQFRSLVRYLAPARDVGKLILYNGKDLWFYDPASQASIRLSPQQRLLGQASNGDVVTVNFARDYRATSAEEEPVQDGDRQPRHGLKLLLEAAMPDASYQRIEMWVDATSHQPVKARFYAQSGALLKTAYYRRYQTVFGAERPTETVIIDGLDPGWVTVMRYGAWVRREVPEAWLQRDYLPRFRPE